MNYLSPYGNRPKSYGYVSPFAELDKQLGSLFANLPAIFDFQADAPFDWSASSVRSRWYENESAYLVRLDLPGAKKDEIKLNLEDGTLTVSAIREQASKDDGEARSSFAYRSTLHAPEGVDHETITAAYEDGVLSLTLPKTEKAKARQISVN